jgi:hypothetical protein
LIGSPAAGATRPGRLPAGAGGKCALDHQGGGTWRLPLSCGG